MRVIALAAATFGLAACAGSYTAPETGTALPEPAKRPPGVACDASYAEHHIGDQATQELGLVIREETGAKSLRWGPPNSVWTMDYREDRVNVRYDAKMKITAVTCG